MAKEIERKFLVKDIIHDLIPELEYKKIKQGYLVANENGSKWKSRVL